MVAFCLGFILGVALEYWWGNHRPERHIREAEGAEIDRWVEEKIAGLNPQERAWFDEEVKNLREGRLLIEVESVAATAWDQGT